MKEHKTLLLKVVSGILSTVLIFVSTFVLVVSADESEEIFCLSDHFSKLKVNYNGTSKERIPANESGTCTQIAMSMLLSYYDFYWNDQFVPTIYTSDGTSHQMGWESGVYNKTTNTVVETFNAYPEADAWDDYKATDKNFNNFAALNDMYYLHPYLISLSDGETINSEIGIQGLMDYQVVQVLEKYLSKRQLGADKGVTVHIEYALEHSLNLETARAELFDTIKEQIENGNPVIFMGVNVDLPKDIINWNQFKMNGHAMIAYDVVMKDGKEDILLHTGWSGGEDAYFNSTEFIYLNSAVWIEIDEEKTPHVCTKKYKDSVDPSTAYCACEIYSTHLSHDNNHIYRNDLDSNNHFMKCHCGEKINIEPHNIAYSFYSSSQHYETCSECAYADAVTHKYNIPCSPTETGHSLKCVCGVVGSTTEEHYAYSYTSQGALLHKVYCKCGYFIGTEGHTMKIIGKYNQCIHCGYVGSGSNLPGQLMSKEEDEDPAETE